MKRGLQTALAVIVIAGSGSIAGLASDTEVRTAAQWPEASRALERIAKLHFPRHYSPREPQHGTHLCSDDEHCGTGHKCCSGHCKAVSVC